MATRAQAITALKSKLDAQRELPLLVVGAPPAKQPRELFLQIGNKRYQVVSIEEAVRMHNTARDACEHGSSKFPRVTIVSSTGLHLYDISYNGRVWEVDAKGERVPLDGMSCDEWVNLATTGARNGLVRL